MGWVVWFGIAIAALIVLARVTASLKAWTIGMAAVLTVTGLTGFLNLWAGFALWALLLLVVVPLNVPHLRRRFLTEPMLAYIRAVLPPMSDTEKVAIDAGTVWWEAELFRGNPRWSKLLDTPAPSLSQEEQAFLDGPVEELCKMLDDWEITHELNDLPPQVWEFIKRNRFFGIIIPKRYGGHGFSALAHSQIVMKVTSRNPTAGVTVMVPNSLGPAELLLDYGTEEQKDHYLPRLAHGEEVPCFALTGPTAGSDATSIPDYGIVCKGDHEGREVLGMRVTWEKRYITLGPVATVLGLAFKVYDPDRLLGGEEELGITCALISTSTPGVNIGRRHDPLGTAFQNGPNSGKDVFIPMDWVIGGEKNVGQGWRMLVESLSVGRGISLPAQGTAAGKFAAHMTGAYARVRKQFNLPIGKFEGVEERLAHMAGLTYIMDAGRLLTTSALDLGEKPSVVSAILKHHNTEAQRQVINDAMDIHGGRGICVGPSNYLSTAYCSLPVSITVEGANILTRSMIIFGQGAMRCHPYLISEVAAASNPNRAAAVADFDEALMGHIGYALSNAARAFLFGLTGRLLASAPVPGPTSRYFGQLARCSAAFAFVADVALLLLGGALKRKEKLSGRFADGLSYMFLCSATLKRFEDLGRPQADLPVVEWAAQYCLEKVERSLDEILRNFPSQSLGRLVRFVVFPVGRRLRAPNDLLGHRAASVLLEPSEARDRLTAGVFISSDSEDVSGRIEHALRKVIAADPIENRLRRLKLVRPPQAEYGAWLQELVQQGTLEESEAVALREAELATRAAIMVDDFPPLEAAEESENEDEAA